MRTEGCEAQLLRALADLPFLDRTEMAAVTGRSRGAVHEAVDRLQKDNICASVLHAANPFPTARRFHLTAAGLRRLAGDEDGMSLNGLVRSRPVSTEWRRSLMERMDALAVVYRLASILSDVAYPLRFRWYRSAKLDAGIELPDGRTVGIVRQGLTADRSVFSQRLWRMKDEPLPSVVLVLTTDGVRLRHARRMLSTTDVPALLAIEREAVAADADDPVWTPSHIHAAVSLRYVLERLEPGGELPQEPRPGLASVPADLPMPGTVADMADHMLPVTLKPAEKRALDLIFDWPWIALGELAGLMGISPQRASQVVNPLEGFNLVARPRDAGARLALTDRGLALLARRDRTSVAAARRRLSVAPVDSTAPYGWRNLTGSRSRQLLRNVEHTAAVHAFLAALTGQARHLGWEVEQLDPPRRASRYFRHDDRMRSVNPDAFSVLRKQESAWPFFLEWERRAVRPSTCLLYTSPSPRDGLLSRMPSSA